MTEAIAYTAVLLKTIWPCIVLGIVSVLLIKYPFTKLYNWCERRTTQKQLQKIYGYRETKIKR